MLDQLLEIANARDLRETPLVNACLKAILERDHQLDAFERAQAELLEGGRSAERAAVRESFEQGFECVRRRRGGARTAGLNPVTDRAALQFLRALGARQFRCRLDRPRANALMLLQLCVRLPDGRVSMRIGVENEHCVHAFFGTSDGTNDG